MMRKPERIEEKRRDVARKEGEQSLKNGRNCVASEESCWNVGCTGKAGVGAFAEGIV